MTKNTNGNTVDEAAVIVATLNDYRATKDKLCCLRARARQAGHSALAMASKLLMAAQWEGAPVWPETPTIFLAQSDYENLLSEISETEKRVSKLLDELESQGVPIGARR